MRQARTVRTLGWIVCALGVVALGCWVCVLLLNFYPAGAECGTRDGYAAIRAHSEANSSLLVVALSCAVAGAIASLAGAIKATGHRIGLPRTTIFVSSSAVFAVGILPFLGIGFLSFAGLVASALSCQN